MSSRDISILIALMIYFIPSTVAFERKHHQKAAIIAFNVFTGWTVLGWIVALWWACTKVRGTTANGQPSEQSLSAAQVGPVSDLDQRPPTLPPPLTQSPPPIPPALPALTMNPLEQLDDFWRESILSGGSNFESKYADFANRVEAQFSHLPQDIVDRNAEYILMAQRDPQALCARLGLPVSAPFGQLDDFWRENLGRHRKTIERKYTDFIKRLQGQVAHLPQAEQDWLCTQLFNRNAVYIATANGDRNALRVRLGLPAQSAATNRLAQVAAETVVRATIWESIAALFRAFR